MLAPYDPDWPARFAAARTEMLAACNELMLDVHHVGSTSGLVAKPIIDLMPVLRRYEDGLDCVKPMESLGYIYRSAQGIEGRHLFVRGEPRTHNVHVFALDHPEVERHLIFRDYLRAHPEARDGYAALKIALAEKFGKDRRAYTEAKTPFCERIDRLARAERG
ncbi:MAG TPA: GrpB family protein [Dongiaceae bacterium]|nr:GrpB family protein [Dongiaceae bacterium]